MSKFTKQLVALKKAITDQNHLNQRRIVSRICACIAQAPDSDQVIKELLSINLAATVNDAICSQLTVLHPTMKLVHHLMRDFHFRAYQFQPILKNILRALIFVVHSDQLEQNQLELFDTIRILDVLLRKFIKTEFPWKQDGSMQSTFVCLLKFIDLVSTHNDCKTEVKTLMVDIFLKLLIINRTFDCVSGSFELILKVASVADELFNRLVTEYKEDGNDLWLFKILQISLRTFESLILETTKRDKIVFKVFESIFSSHMKFSLEQLLSRRSIVQSPELIKLSISILNAILWTPGFRQNFYSKVLKLFIGLSSDSMLFWMCESSTKLTRHTTTYTAKIFLAALITHAQHASIDKHTILSAFLDSRLPGSIIELTSYEIELNYKVLILLYGSPFLIQRWSRPSYSYRVLKNLVIALSHHELAEDEIWIILTTIAHCLYCAPLNELEYVGVQRISEILLDQALRTVTDIQKISHHIDKYVVLLAQRFSSSICSFNSMIFLYLSQQPNLVSAKVEQIIPTSNVLPLLISSDSNQVANALKILKRKHLTEDDLSFIIQQCFGASNNDEAIIGGAINIIGRNLAAVSQVATCQVYGGIILHLETKKVATRMSKECYLMMVNICVKLVKLQVEKKHGEEEL